MLDIITINLHLNRIAFIQWNGVLYLILLFGLDNCYLHNVGRGDVYIVYTCVRYIFSAHIQSHTNQTFYADTIPHSRTRSSVSWFQATLIICRAIFCKLAAYFPLCHCNFFIPTVLSESNTVSQFLNSSKLIYLLLCAEKEKRFLPKLFYSWIFALSLSRKGISYWGQSIRRLRSIDKYQIQW